MFLKIKKLFKEDKLMNEYCKIAQDKYTRNRDESKLESYQSFKKEVHESPLKIVF